MRLSQGTCQTLLLVRPSVTLPSGRVCRHWFFGSSPRAMRSGMGNALPTVQRPHNPAPQTGEEQTDDDQADQADEFQAAADFARHFIGQSVHRFEVMLDQNAPSGVERGGITGQVFLSCHRILVAYYRSPIGLA